jgi:3-dehydroquinate dehydratase
VVAGVVSGLGWRGYLAALDALVGLLHERRGAS